MNAKQSGRRRFLKNGAALAGLAVGTIQPASGQSAGPEKTEAPPRDIHTYGERSRFEEFGSHGRHGLIRPGASGRPPRLRFQDPHAGFGRDPSHQPRCIS